MRSAFDQYLTRSWPVFDQYLTRSGFPQVLVLELRPEPGPPMDPVRQPSRPRGPAAAGGAGAGAELRPAEGIRPAGGLARGPGRARLIHTRFTADLHLTYA
jgi:hypothetical protein